MNPQKTRVSTPPLDWRSIRAGLANTHGRRYWRSLEQLARTPAFEKMLRHEFPLGAAEWPEDLNRRSFLKFAAAAFALAGLTACTKQPTREIFPYVNQPAELVLGEPLFYATSMPLGGFATGALAKSREGHPIKVDGNPDHPAALGGSSVWLQCSILQLYDPDRSQAVLHNGDLSTWARCLDDLNNLVAEEKGRGGAGLRFLTETVTSPTLAGQLKELLQRFPKAKWHQYEPITRDHVRAGAGLAFGEIVETQCRFDAAAIIVSLEADFLYTHPDRLRYARQFADGRRISAGKKELNRLYVVESSPSVTGTMADHRLPLASAKVVSFARILAKRLGIAIETAPAAPPEIPAQWLDGLVKDLEDHRGTSLIVAGEWQPPIVHALAHALNDRLGNVGKTVAYTEPAEANPLDQLQSMSELAQDIGAGKVDNLFIFDGNPAYTAPVDLGFGELLLKIKRTIHLGLELDETGARCTWHVPAAHFLESWGDARSFDGTISLIQPLIEPLYGGKTIYELLGALSQQQPARSDYEIVRDFWRSQNKWADFESGWRQALHNGFIANSELQPRQVTLKDPQTFGRSIPEPGQDPTRPPLAAHHDVARDQPREAASPVGLEFSADSDETRAPVGPLASDVEICFRPDPSVWDGRFANNGWLQECPRPVTKLTWDNAALVSPSLAQRCGLAQNDVLELRVAERRLRAPVWVTPGQAENSITLHLGYGRSRVGRVGSGVGVNAYELRTAGFQWLAPRAQVFKTAARHLLVSTQTHHSMDDPDRQVLRECELRQFLANPQVIKDSVEQPPTDETLYYPDEYPYQAYKWGMSIDLNTCIGCNACLVACEAENNIPFVGKDQIHRNREMFWIRIDTYYKDSLDNPGFAHMPVPCMHCEHAPCELVCPVEATVHDSEGLNLQVYNRCVGTRFCSNNCPYKVRRFNFYQYSQYHQPSFRPMYNPEVTVRWRGVMEKCTYCIQRISAARIGAEKENRRIRESEIRTACQQACPATAIVFGDLNAADSQVARLKQHPLDYSMLGQLNTRPRTTYLAKVENSRPT
ncbi:MAG TPA: TAT-variant-translocated molybdopterin oxidoreductase [Verrucomicrobiae bacterium]|nr:TAT-variant-translocated molybdopterin oxidoreductase [Verrucomicrobiae bacterium]